jgi:hypothetical protein
MDIWYQERVQEIVKENRDNIDGKAQKEIKQLPNKIFRLNNAIFGGKNIEFYNRVKCNEMIKGVFYVIDAIHYYSDMYWNMPNEQLISNTHIYAMEFDKIEGKYCKFISSYGIDTPYLIDKYYFYNTVDNELNAIKKRNFERNMMKLIMNRYLSLGKIEINKLVNEYL